MLTALCDQCGTAGTYAPLLTGQRVKCKACPAGWVRLPAADGTVPPAPLPPPPRPPVATLIAPPPVRCVPETWTPKHAADAPPAADDPVQPDQPETLAEVMTNRRRAALWAPATALVFMFFGFGSAVLWLVGIEFVILAWLTPLQPLAGVVAGLIRLAVLVLYLLFR